MPGRCSRLTSAPAVHVFDLLRGREAEPHRGRQASEIRTFLVRDDVTCLAKMPARLAVKAAVGAIEIAVRDARPAWQVHLCNAEGKSLLSAVAGATTRVSLVELGAKGKTAVYLKLMDGPGCSMPSPCPTDMETRTMSACPDRRLVGSPISPENGRKCCTMTTGRNTSRASAILCGRNLRSYLPDRRLPFDGWCSFSRCPSLRPALVSRRCRRTCSTMAAQLPERVGTQKAQQLLATQVEIIGQRGPHAGHVATVDVVDLQRIDDPAQVITAQEGKNRRLECHERSL